MKRFKRFVADELPSQLIGIALGTVGAVVLLLGSIWLASMTSCGDVASIKIGGVMLVAGCN